MQMTLDKQNKDLKPIEPISESLENLDPLSACSDQFLVDVVTGKIDLMELIKKELEKRDLNP